MISAQQVLTDEYASVCRFLELLNAESVALRTGALDKLESIGLEKSTLIAELEAKTQARLRYFDVANATDAKQSIYSWFKAHPEEYRAFQCWQDLLAIAKLAHEGHQANEVLVVALLQRTNEALDILVQRQRDQTTYGNNGQASVPTGSRIIDSA